MIIKVDEYFRIVLFSPLQPSEDGLIAYLDQAADPFHRKPISYPLYYYSLHFGIELQLRFVACLPVGLSHLVALFVSPITLFGNVYLQGESIDL